MLKTGKIIITVILAGLSLNASAGCVNAVALDAGNRVDNGNNGEVSSYVRQDTMVLPKSETQGIPLVRVETQATTVRVMADDDRSLSSGWSYVIVITCVIVLGVRYKSRLKKLEN